MKVRLFLTLAGVAISFAMPALMAQDAMKAVMADEVVWKDDTLFKRVQIANLLGDPAKAEPVVIRVKFPPILKFRCTRILSRKSSLCLAGLSTAGKANYKPPKIAFGVPTGMHRASRTLTDSAAKLGTTEFTVKIQRKERDPKLLCEMKPIGICLRNCGETSLPW
jgi:hypothetical protein